MSRALRRTSGDLRGRIAVVGGALIALNGLAWVLAFVALGGRPMLMGAALLAYGLGLRHAVDADHIAAIDNVTRKLMQDGKRPASVGLYFSLGHSTIVAALTLLVAFAASVVEGRFQYLRDLGGVIGTGVSALFLFAIAGANLAILASLWRSFRQVRDGQLPKEAPALNPASGPLARVFRGLFCLIEHGWQMYFLGLLFGLGFDTATQVGLLAASAAGAARGLSPWSVMVLPALFCAGMALVDTADGVLMLGASGWAFVKLVRKLFYNLTITALSVLIAVLVGSIEVLGLIDGYLEPSGSFWSFVAALNEHLVLLGYGVIGLFVLGCLVSVAIYKIRRYEAV